jgi:membrane protease YdiL (CAAX protease family)
MSSLTTYCPNCGNAFDSVFVQDTCPHCAMSPDSAEPQEAKLWGPGTGFLVWMGSFALPIAFQVPAFIVWFFIRYNETGQFPPKIELDWLFTVLSLALSFPAFLLTLLMCWIVVTARGRRSFRQTLEWSWHTQFKWVHAVALAFLMVGFGYLIDKFLPSQETDFDRLLKMGTTVRVLIAALAVLAAPVVEEVVYRGILYSGIERAWGKGAGVVLVTLLFAGGHYVQYRESYAALIVIVSLSLVLTLLRAVTGKLLPCIATHLVFNGLNAVFLLMAPEEMPDRNPVKTAVAIICRVFGVGDL